MATKLVFKGRTSKQTSYFWRAARHQPDLEQAELALSLAWSGVAAQTARCDSLVAELNALRRAIAADDLLDESDLLVVPDLVAILERILQQVADFISLVPGLLCNDTVRAAQNAPLGS